MADVCDISRQFLQPTYTLTGNKTNQINEAEKALTFDYPFILG